MRLDVVTQSIPMELTLDQVQSLLLTQMSGIRIIMIDLQQLVYQSGVSWHVKSMVESQQPTVVDLPSLLNQSIPLGRGRRQGTDPLRSRGVPPLQSSDKIT